MKFNTDIMETLVNICAIVILMSGAIISVSIVVILFSRGACV